jgi:hypothetical protein
VTLAAFTRNEALTSWFQDLLHGPVVSNGDYFDRLRERVESSAPVGHPCG